MSKRKATGQLTPAVTAKRHEVIPADRARLFSARLKSLNQQFAEWVKQQATSCAQQLWLDGVQHYQDYVADLLEEFKDIVGEDAQMSRQRDQATPGAMFSTPVGAAAAAAAGGSGSGSSNDKAAAAPSTGGSTGRKSVTWADGSTALTPAQGAAANGTPNPNTQNAGHTPAPANFGRFDAGTPSSSDMATPQFKLPPSSEAGTPAEVTPAARIMLGVIGSGGATSAAADGGGKASDTAAKTPAGSPGGFAFGSGGFGTPVAAEADVPAKGKDSSSPLAFAFGTPTTSAVTADKPSGGAAAAAADKGPGEARAFTFGTPAASSSGAAAEAAKASTPTFGGFGAGSGSSNASPGNAAAPPMFSFGVTPSPGAAAGSSPGFSFGVGASSSAATGGSSGAAAAAGDKGKTTGFSFGVASSSNAAAGGSTTAPVPTFGTPSSGAAGGSTSMPAPAAGGFSFGVSSSAATANTSSSSGAAAGSSPPAFAFGGAGSAAGGGSSATPPLSFGAAGSTPAFGAAGSTPAFGAAAAGSTPGFGTPGTGFSFGAGANGTPGNFFKFPAPTEAAGSDGGEAAAGGGGVDAEEAEPEEEKTQVQRDERFTVMFSKVAVLNMAVKNEAGAWDWQNRGKGQMSVRKDTQTGKFYIFFNSEGQGKQLVMHELKAKDKPEGVPGSPAKVRMTLLNTLYTVKKEPGCQPEPVVQYERRMSIVRFANAEAAEEFKTVVEQHKPSE